MRSPWSCATRTRSRPSLGELDLHLIGEGRHEQLWDALGAHPRRRRRRRTAFAVWAPGARAVSVVGDFNGWNERAAPDAIARRRAASGSCSSPRRPRATPTSSRSAAPTACVRLKADPCACGPSCRRRPARWSSSRVTRGPTTTGWSAGATADAARGRSRSTRCTSARGALNPLEGNRSLTYRELADELARLRARPRLHARRADARRWSTRSTARGAIR